MWVRGRLPAGYQSAPNGFFPSLVPRASATGEATRFLCKLMRVKVTLSGLKNWKVPVSGKQTAPGVSPWRTRTVAAPETAAGGPPVVPPR